MANFSEETLKSWYKPASETEDTKIVVQGEDSRRFRLYERALSRYGYRKVKFQDGWEMVKFIERKKENRRSRRRK